MAQMEQSLNDTKSYRRVVLKNGLEVLLIHRYELEEIDNDSDSDDSSCSDTETGMKRAAAALSVGIGSFAETNRVEGLAHYLEHMVFMGE